MHLSVWIFVVSPELSLAVVDINSTSLLGQILFHSEQPEQLYELDLFIRFSKGFLLP